jgi:ABC-type multidrug transport system fused ATPase/permease subunit
MYDPVNGTITLDGDNLATLDKETLRGNITVISQAPYIFNMTIRENLKIVKDGLSDEDMIKYAKIWRTFAN